MTTPLVTPLKKHKIQRKIVLAPLHGLPIDEVDWTKNLLAEHIWMDLLYKAYSSDYYKLFSSLLDVIDTLVPQPNVASGLVSDFALVPEDKRADFIQNNREIIAKCFPPPIGKPLSLFLECPLGWLIPEESKVKDDRDVQEAVEALADSILRLWPAKNEYVGHIRVLPFTRFCKNGKVHFLDDQKFEKIIDLLSKYPGGLTIDEHLECQQFCRTSMGCILGMREMKNEWSKYFWSHNMELTDCIYPSDTPSKEDPEEKKLVEICEYNLKLVDEYFNGVFLAYKSDPYDPINDEINIGLLSRIHSLYHKIIRNCEKGEVEVARILLRCLADTAIAYCYLIKMDSDELYQKFFEYSKGREKLLLLHIQDNFPDHPTPSGESVTSLIDSLGGPFSPSTIDIDLANWTDISPRNMAEDLGLKHVYNIIYEPTSADIHGLWSNLKNFHLTPCLNPLHRLHKLPFGGKVGLDKAPVDCSTSVLAAVIRKSHEKFGWPVPADDFKIVGNCNPSWMQIR